MLVGRALPKQMYSKTQTSSIKLRRFASGGPPMDHFTVHQTCKHGGCEMAITFFCHSLCLAHPASKPQRFSAKTIMPNTPCPMQFMPSTSTSPWSLARPWCAPVCSHGPCRASAWWWQPLMDEHRGGRIGRLTSPWQHARCGRCIWDGKRRWSCLRGPCWSLARQGLRRLFGLGWSGPEDC